MLMEREPVKRHWTVEEYLAYEEETHMRYEYIDGEIYAMAGGSDKHSIIKANCTVEVGVQLRGKSCRLYDSDMKVKISDIKYVYPDFSVVCGQAKFSDDTHTMLLNPTFVLEVVSPSSEQYDKVVKLEYYRSLPSVQAYLILDQERVFAQLSTRQDNGWLLREFTDLESTVPLEVINPQLNLAEAYRDIEFNQ